MVEDARKQRHSPRHGLKGIRLSYAKGGLLAFLSKDSAGQELPVLNVSVDGLQFLASNSFEIGQRLKIHVAGMAPGQPIDVECEVRWCRRVPRRGAHRVGVMFLDTDPGTHRQLEEAEVDIEGQTMHLVCPSCQAAVGVKRKHEGRQAKCPRCGTAMELAEPEELPALPQEQRAQESSGLIQAAGGKGAAAAGRVPMPRSSRIPAELARFVRKTVRNRMHLEIIQLFAGAKGQAIYGVKELAVKLKQPQKKVQLALREMVIRGVVKEIGIKTFNYDPAPGPKRDIADLLSALASPTKRSEVMAMVIRTEDGKK